MADGNKILADLQKCHDEAVACVKKAGNDPIKIQQCIAKYLACIIKPLQQVSAEIARGGGGGATAGRRKRKA